MATPLLVKRSVQRYSPPFRAATFISSSSSLIRCSRLPQATKSISTDNRKSASVAVAESNHLDDDHGHNQSSQESRSSQLTEEQRRFLDSALRVNHAGELAATLIYTAQTPQIVQKHPQLRPLMQHMYDQEANHFATFNHLLAKHRIRPTIMYPVWKVAATALGYSTAIMGREAAMACTEAVETEIGDHYNNQVKELLAWARDIETRGETVGDELKELLVTLRRIRDEELEHLDHAVENDAKEAKPYDLLTNAIRGGCRAAIWISERV